MALPPAYVRAGAMRAFWDTGGSEVELGLTADESTLVIEQAGEEITAEQYGASPIDYLYGGQKVTARLLFLDWNNTSLLKLLPGSTQSAGPTRKAWQIGNIPGVLASSLAKLLRLHPVKTADITDDSEDIVLYLAAPIMVAEIALSNRRARALAVSFLALVDTSKADGNLLGRWREDLA